MGSAAAFRGDLLFISSIKLYKNHTTIIVSYSVAEHDLQHLCLNSGMEQYGFNI